MAARVEVGWNFSVIGALSISVTDSGGTFAVSDSSGKYCHTDLSNVEGSGLYTDYASELQAGLNAGTSIAGSPYTVTWDGTGPTYNIATSDATGFSLAFTTAAARRVLGFSGNVSGATTHTSDVRPYYVLVASKPGAAEPSDDYTKGDRDRVLETRSGLQYAQRFEGSVTYNDFDFSGQPDAQTYSRRAPDGLTAGDVPWTFEAFIEHAGAIEPFLVVDDNESTVHRLRENGAKFDRDTKRRMFRNYQGEMIWSFLTRVEGRL